MKLNTASAVISLSRQLETDSAAFYENIAKKHSINSDLFLSFAKENRKFISQIESAYYGVITDAIEGCFAFDLDTDKHQIDTSVPEDIKSDEALKKAINLDEQMIKFYTDAAEQSRTLMADVPRAFTLVAKKRNSRIEKLQSLL